MKDIVYEPWKGRAFIRAHYPGILPLTDSQIEVLEALAQDGPTNGYQLAKKTGKAYSHVNSSLKVLARKNMAIPLGEQRTPRGVLANIYALDVRGAMLVLYRIMQHPDKPNHAFRRIVQKYGDLLPLVFGKWGHFQESGELVKKIARFRLKVVVDTFAHYPRSFEKGIMGIGTPEMGLEQKLTWFFYFQLRHFKYSEAWQLALRSEAEIRNYIVVQLKDIRERLMKQQKLVEETLSSILA